MTLRNALGDLALDASIQALTASVDALAGLTLKMIRMQSTERFIPYARDTADQMRVVVASGATDVTAVRWGQNNSAPVWFSTGAASAIDQRELLREQSRANARMVRNGRWKFT